MQEAVPVGEGAMAAVLGMEREQIEELCEACSSGEFSLLQILTAGQIVIAGHSKAVERAIERIKQEGKKAVLLPSALRFILP